MMYKYVYLTISSNIYTQAYAYTFMFICWYSIILLIHLFKHSHTLNFHNKSI